MTDNKYTLTVWQMARIALCYLAITAGTGLGIYVIMELV